MVLGERFLTQPDLFPARMAGMPGGDGELVIELAGGPYAISGLSDRQQTALSRRYGDLALEVAAPEGSMAVRVFAVAPGEFLDDDWTGRDNEFDFDYSPDRVRVAGRSVMAQLRWSPEAEAALWTCVEDGPEFLELFENCFRICVAYRLLALGGALVHSAGIHRNGRAWLFCGYSGAGKTTLARRSPELGFGVLSDDLNAVVLRDAVPVAVRMPFAGELRHLPDSPAEIPLAAIGALDQASEVEWHRLSPARAAAALATCCPFVNRDPHRVPKLLANLEALVSAVPVGTLSMTVDGDYRPVLETVS